MLTNVKNVLKFTVIRLLTVLSQSVRLFCLQDLSWQPPGAWKVMSTLDSCSIVNCMPWVWLPDQLKKKYNARQLTNANNVNLNVILEIPLLTTSWWLKLEKKLLSIFGTRKNYAHSSYIYGEVHNECESREYNSLYFENI